jgi:hypothetical protein
MTNNYLRHLRRCCGCKLDQAVEFSKWRTDRVNEAILEKWIFEKGAKTNDVSAELF